MKDTSLLAWQIIVGVGTLASLAAWMHQFFLKRPSKREVIYPLLAILFAASSGYLAFQNHELRSFRAQARELASIWPETTYDGHFHEAKCKGIILRGMQFLEMHKGMYPESYDNEIKKLTAVEDNESLGLTRNADAMITIIRSIAGEKINLRRY